MGLMAEEKRDEFICRDNHNNVRATFMTLLSLPRNMRRDGSTRCSGSTINRIAYGLLSSLLIFAMCACSGLPNRGSGGGGAGSATLSLTLRATPPSPSSHLSILTFRATVTGVSLTPSSGGTVSVDLVSGTTTSCVVEFTRLQSDSALLSSAVTIPAGTYSSLAVTFSDVLLTYCTQPSS